MEEKVEKKNNDIQRALILQGGGALGAFEAGAIKAFCEKLSEEDKHEVEQGRRKPRKGPLFNIVAGASIGAVNAAILVHNVIHRPNGKNTEEQKIIWEDAVNSVYSFYDEISKRGGMIHPMWWIDNFLLENQLFKNFWLQWEGVRKIWNSQSDTFYQFLSFGNKDGLQEGVAKNPFQSWLYFASFPDKWGLPADPEIARRYYSYWWSLIYGSPGVLGPAMIQPDTKFLDPLWFTHIFTRFNNDPLVETMKNYWPFDMKEYSAIKTEKKDESEQPRLLIVTMDVHDFTTPVIFDSFAKKNNSKSKKRDSDANLWYTEYGEKYNDGDNTPQRKYRINYPEGISVDHVKASMATPLRYEYPQFWVTNQENNKEEKRTFWDGAFLANTPLRQVIQAYREYWKKDEEEGLEKIPDLEIFIVNLYPTVEKGDAVPSSADTIQDRQTDITFHDRTKYEIRVDQMRSDYIELLDDIIPILQKHDSKKLDKILERKTRKSENKNNFVKKKELIRNRFKIGRVVYVERTEGIGSTIFGKAFDFSPKTIEELKEKGYEAAKSAFVKGSEEYCDFCESN